MRILRRRRLWITDDSVEFPQVLDHWNQKLHPNVAHHLQPRSNQLYLRWTGHFKIKLEPLHKEALQVREMLANSHKADHSEVDGIIFNRIMKFVHSRTNMLQPLSRKHQRMKCSSNRSFNHQNWISSFKSSKVWIWYWYLHLPKRLWQEEYTIISSPRSSQKQLPRWSSPESCQMNW